MHGALFKTATKPETFLLGEELIVLRIRKLDAGNHEAVLVKPLMHSSRLVSKPPLPRERFFNTGDIFLSYSHTQHPINHQPTAKNGANYLY